MVRHRWKPLAVMFAIGAFVCVAVEVAVPSPVDRYLVGAIAASTVWWMCWLVASLDGSWAWRLGVHGEEMTTIQLGRLRKAGWRFVNHVMLEAGEGDIDHALIGPGGAFAIDSKYRSEWSEMAPYLDEMAASARRQATKLKARMQMKSLEVRPIVAMWGPFLDEIHPEPFDHQGVLFCPGRLLIERLKAIPSTTPAETVERAFDTLGEYVARRDVGEQGELGAPVRPVEAHIWDFTLAMAAVASVLIAVTQLAPIPPTGLWASLAAVAIAVVCVLIRRRFRPRWLS